MTDKNVVSILPDGRMDTKNTALYIGRAVHTLAQWRSDGVGPPYIKCGRIYYYQQDIDDWLRNGKRGE